MAARSLPQRPLIREAASRCSPSRYETRWSVRCDNDDGDEFAILLTGECDIEAAEAVADKVLAAASQPFDIDGRSVRVSASIGVAVMARTDAGLHELLSHADGVLNRAKAAGRGRQVSRPLEQAQKDSAASAH